MRRVIGKRRLDLPESGNMCEQTIEVPWRLERSCRFHARENRTGKAIPKTPGPTLGTRWRREKRKQSCATMVPPSEGNEATRDERQEVGAS